MSQEDNHYSPEPAGSLPVDFPSSLAKLGPDGLPQGKASGVPLSSLESLQECAQQLIQEMNAKRQRDATILSELKTELEDHTRTSFENIEKFMLDKSQATGEVIQRKLQVLFNTLNHVAELKEELEQFKIDLGLLNSDIQKPGIA